MDFKSCLPIEYPQGPEGMMLRDWFAGMALFQVAQLTTIGSSADAAKCCYELADALLVERNRRRDERQNGGA